MRSRLFQWDGFRSCIFGYFLLWLSRGYAASSKKSTLAVTRLRRVTASLRGHRYPGDGSKYFFDAGIVFLAFFYPIYVGITRFWGDFGCFPKCPFWHPCVVVGTPGLGNFIFLTPDSCFSHFFTLYMSKSLDFEHFSQKIAFELW